MKSQFLSIIFTAFSFVLFAQTKEEKLQQLMQAYSAIGKLNGSVMITQKGKTLLNHGYGLRNVTKNLPNNPNSIFQIGSVTKQFTAAIILKLQENEQLNLLDKISMYFPDYPNGDKIRVEHLLTHTSGIFNYTDDREFMQTKAMNPISQKEMLNTFSNKPLKFVPGSDFEYSNSNYILLGYIIEKVTNIPYEKVVEQMIFKPLKMSSSGFDFNKLHNTDQAKGYIVYSKENSKESDEFDPTVSYAAGGMYTTTADLNKWLIGLASDKIISKELYKKATTPITAKQKEEAVRVINELGYTESFNRRSATLDDVKEEYINFLKSLISIPGEILDENEIRILEEIDTSKIINQKNEKKIL